MIPMTPIEAFDLFVQGKPIIVTPGTLQGVLLHATFMVDPNTTLADFRRNYPHAVATPANTPLRAQESALGTMGEHEQGPGRPAITIA